MSPADIAIMNVEAVIRGEITEPSEGTLAARVLDLAKNYGRAIVTVTVSPPSQLELGGGV